MTLTRITIKGDLAHFKMPAFAKVQRTYGIPPISTIIGILQNIYNKDINNFMFGYTIDYNQKHRDLMTIYKEFNMQDKKFTDKERFIRDTCIVEYLTDVTLIIYTNITEEIELNDVLTLGKANCLATITEIKQVDLIDYKGKGYNQYTSKEIGNGQIRRINTLTKYNCNTDRYDIYTNVFRENIEFEYDKNYDIELEQNVFLFKYKNEGVVQWD